MRLAGTTSPLGTGLGLFAVLFQAILFGWHHHELPPRGSQATAVVENPTAPQQPADEDGCEICQVLHHLTAAPADPPLALPPVPAGRMSRADASAVPTRPLALAFHARAPPPLA
jgi:hypothetical protein